ncbi:MAG: hypothetical protein ABFR05_06535 [Bacteroidota bacterium]
MGEYDFTIQSFEDLKSEKQRLKQEIKRQEFEFRNNPISRIAASFSGGSSIADTLFSSSSVGSRDTRRSGINSMFSSFLLASKATRKYYVAYTIAKEMVPFTIKKVNEFIKK